MSKKKNYIIVGDNNYWYSAISDATESNLRAELKSVKEHIKMGQDMFHPRPNTDPNELYVYEFTKEIKAVKV